MELEKNKRLSESLLWKLQHDAYCQFGIEAWSQKGVPSYITSNPFIAKSYAKVVVSYFKDLIQQKRINQSEPVYIFDLGAGTGRLGYLFLKEFCTYMPEANICYVMTDIVQENLDFCRRHPLLQPYIEKGMLDFAFYHHQFIDEPLTLMVSNRTIKRSSNSIILLANYFFDTVPQDLFRIKDGQVEEGRITLLADDWNEGETPDVIDHLKWELSYNTIENPANYYPKFPQANAILRMYQEMFEGISFLFPIGAMESLKYFAKISENRFFLLAGDQGVCTESQVRNWGEPRLSLHGSFSISVSYHALALFLHELGGEALLTEQPDPLFVVMGGVLGNDSRAVRFAFQENINAFEPSDYWKWVSNAMDNPQNLTLEQLLLMIKLGNWDPTNMHTFFPRIRELLPQASEEQRRKLAFTIEKIWDNFYSISKEGADFVLNLGVLLYDMKLYSDALKYFERALQLNPEVEHARHNIQLCFRHLPK